MLTVVNLTHLHPLDPSVSYLSPIKIVPVAAAQKTPKKRGKILGWKKRPPVVHVGGQAGVTLQNSFHMKWGMPYMPIQSIPSVWSLLMPSHNSWSAIFSSPKKLLVSRCSNSMTDPWHATELPNSIWSEI